MGLTSSKFATVLVLASALSVAADDSVRFRSALKSAREFMFACHLRAEVALGSRGPEEEYKKEEFKYDRYPDVEQMRLGEGRVFARKKGGRWVKSDDWGETGTPVSAKQSEELDFDVQIALIAWNPTHTSKDKSQGADVMKVISRSKDKHSEQFVFECTRERPTQGAYPRYYFTKYDDVVLVDRFSGPIVIGAQKLFLTVNYNSFIRFKNARVEVMREASPPSKR
jgi:hypothetical protein